MARTERLKWVEYDTGDRREQLFDIKADPNEVNNLASNGCRSSGSATASAAIIWISSGPAWRKQVVNRPPRLPCPELYLIHSETDLSTALARDLLEESSLTMAQRSLGLPGMAYP